jgi:OOP family OmpA-OmpF porin
MKLRLALVGLALAVPGISQALTLDFPTSATQVAEKNVAHDSYFLPLAAFTDGPVPGITAEGALKQQSWKIGASDLTTLQILAPLRAQLLDEGYTPIFECESKICGGFDFRFQVDVLPEPDMHVNLGDYRYLVAQRDDGDAAEYVSLIVSRSANAGFVQLTQIGAADEMAALTASTKAPSDDAIVRPPNPVGKRLETQGHATLDDLVFKTGSSKLGEEQFQSLAELAEYLISHPTRRIVLVGHTDAEGTLDNNIALSRKRAEAVAQRLVQAYKVPPNQVGADGVGFLAPRASNLTDTGRAQNRRVEVILTSTQ